MAKNYENTSANVKTDYSESKKTIENIMNSLEYSKALFCHLSALSSLESAIRDKATKIITAVLQDSQKAISDIQACKSRILDILKSSKNYATSSQFYIPKDFVLHCSLASINQLLQSISEIFSINIGELIKEIPNFSGPCSSSIELLRHSMADDVTLTGDSFTCEEKLKIFKNNYEIDIWHPGQVTCMHLSERTKKLLTAGEDGLIIIWCIRQWSILKIIEAHSSKINAICVSNFGLIFSGGSDMTFRAFSIDHYEEELKFNISSAINCICLSNAEEKALIGTEEGVLQIWDANARYFLLKLKPPNTWSSWMGMVGKLQSSINFIRITYNDKLAITGCLNGYILIWDLSKLCFLSAIGTKYYITSLIINLTSQFCISSTNEGKIYIWNLSKLKQEAVLTSSKGIVTCIGLTADGNTLISGSDSIINVWSLDSYKLQFSLEKHNNRISGLVILNDDSFITGDDSGVIFQWYLSTRAAVELSGHLRPVNKLEINAGKQILYSCSDDGVIKVNYLHEGIVKELVGHRGVVNFVHLNTYNKLIYSAGSDGCVRVWNSVEAKQLLWASYKISKAPVEKIDIIKVPKSGNIILSRLSVSKNVTILDVNGLNQEMEISNEDNLEIALKRYPENNDLILSMH